MLEPIKNTECRVVYQWYQFTENQCYIDGKYYGDIVYQGGNLIRVKLIAEYKSLPNGVGIIGAGLMTVNIQMAEKAISNNDVIEMLVQYEKLKSCE